MWTRRLGHIVPKILVADDNTNIQKMVVLAFEERGINVTSVGNGEAAVRRIPDLNPDLVLADVFMPVRNGYEVCEFVKKDERFSHVPVILLVGAFDPLDEKEARRVGADGVLKKPFVPPDPLIAMVMSALEKNPKIAAELAKAREVVVAPPEPPMPALEIPAKTEPKPLPEFPEPTAEEAAAIYGFGKGVRNLDDEQEADGPKAPVGEANEEVEEEFDGAATTSDWRRSAADFDVPEEAGGKLAFASDEDFNFPSFPSERDVPPRHIRVQKPAEEIEPVVADHSPEPAVTASVEQPPASAIIETEPEREPVPVAAEPEAVSADPPAPEPEAKNEPGIVSKAMHWMDMMSPAPAEHSHSGWMSNLLGFRKEPEATPVPPAPQAPSEPGEPIAEAQPEIEAMNEPVAEKSSPAPIAQSEIETSETAQSESAPPLSEPWFAPPPTLREIPHQAAHNHEPAPELVAAAPAESVDQHAVEPLDEIEREPEQFEPALRDPMLDESPAVHVEPEPLLMNEEPEARPEYGTRPEKVSPLHSFFSPASGDPVVDDQAASDPAARTEFPSFQPAPVEAAADEFEERIPTVPPPNREALATIPFLNPPATSPQEIHSEEAPAHTAPASDSGTVDAAVRRVLEKLEPQLHELLSQGILKPLVENMLQKELEKKDK